MSDKPRIGINGDFRPAKKDAFPLSWFHTGYYDCITAAKPGGLPMLIPPLADDDDLQQYLEMLDGVVLTGCNFDLDPIRLGLERHPATRNMPIRREDFDRRIATLAVEMRLPILAIGSGMQTLNVVCGGTLFQHIPEDIQRPLLHRDPVETTLRHVLDIVPGTRVDTIYGPGEIRVNSQHHMAIDQLADLFRVSATCPDGVIEAYESIDEYWFCLGVQWHPENETSSALDMQVFETFLEACVQSQGSNRKSTAMARKAA
ncbi:MAG: gamma-glutamyl-gamma-aminobutyrate hydrolase [Planctomycetaceae bacterium]|nr:gamma-glutamyl-gamma-aminobutyrate hydrolase [Planctomycetaceae bacterium]